MKFENPYLLNLIWALIPVFMVMVWGMMAKKKILSGFAEQDILKMMIPGLSFNRLWIKAVFLLSVLLFGIIALAGPLMGFKWEKTSQRGVDIMIALDCSKSMLARDIKPDRLERAKREIIDLLGMMRSDRAGLVAFSGSAVLQCPLTLDHTSFHIFLNSLEPGFLPVGGTDLTAAVEQCYKGFEEDSATDKAIIIISDGENTADSDSSEIEEKAEQMAKAGIKIFCIGVGDTPGAPVPDENGGFIKDEKGSLVLSRVDETTLKKIADLTGGIYVRSVAGDMDLDLIYQDKILGTMERKTLNSGRKKVWENRFQWFLFPAVIFFLIEMMISRTNRKNKAGVLFIFACLTASVVSFPAPLQAESVFSSVKSGLESFENKNYEQSKKYFIDAQLERPDDEHIYYNIGTAAYMNKEYELAQGNFSQAMTSEDKQLRHDAMYNLANTYYRMGRMDESIKGYEAVLKEFPEDKQAKENLEFVKEKKKEQGQQKQESEKNKDNQDNKDKDKQGKDQKDSRSKEDRAEKQDNRQKDQNKAGNQQQPDESEKGSQKQQTQKNQGTEDQNQENMEAEGSQSGDEDNQENGRKMQGQTPDKNSGKKPAATDRHVENMLNRLEDRPGRAMMPLMRKQNVEKDW